MPKKANSPIYFTKLVIENIRSFRDRQELMLVDPQGVPASWTLIVGDNGVGKTTLLQCLARMRPVFNSPSEEGADDHPKPVGPELSREADKGVFDDLVRSPGDACALLEAELSIGTPLNGPRCARSGTVSTKFKMTRADGRITDVDSEGSSGPDKPSATQEPLVLAYGAGRHPKETGVSKADATDPIQSLFMVEAALHDAEKLLIGLEFARMKGHEGANERLDRLKCALAEILPDFDYPEDIEIRGPLASGARRSESGARIKTSRGTVSLDQLGLGSQTVYAWTIDIAWRMIEHFSNSENPLNEPAIVIVDEIDLHLHPRWQRNIREYLVEHFPNVQFIATAYSPLMAQVSLDGNMVVVQNSGDHARICSDPVVVSGWRLDQVVTSDLFGLVSARPPGVERILRRRQELVEKDSLSKEEQEELDGLNHKVRNLPTETSHEDQAAIDIIRRAAEALQSNGRIP